MEQDNYFFLVICAYGVAFGWLSQKSNVLRWWSQAFYIFITFFFLKKKISSLQLYTLEGKLHSKEMHSAIQSL